MLCGPPDLSLVESSFTSTQDSVHACMRTLYVFVWHQTIEQAPAPHRGLGRKDTAARAAVNTVAAAVGQH